MSTTQAVESVTLYFRQGSSDKVYQAAIESSGDGFVVNFAYGRRGSTLTAGTKTSQPVPLKEAKVIFEKLVAEKTAKGYSPGEDGTPYQGTAKGERATGIVPQLLNPADESELDNLLTSPEWCMQQKHDGRRVLIRKTGSEVVGINRDGLVIPLPQSVAEAAERIPGDFLLDGECVGDTYYAFDLLESDGDDLRRSPYDQRLMRLICRANYTSACLQTVKAFSSTCDKLTAFNHLRVSGCEGVVFKRWNAPYSPGRPASGGDQLKYKFTESASFIVTEVTPGKRSVSLAVRDGRKTVGVGKVTIPANARVPQVGSVVEVQYLYAYPGGCLFQPVFLRERDDIPAKNCTRKQLKYKTAVVETDPE